MFTDMKCCFLFQWILVIACGIPTEAFKWISPQLEAGNIVRACAGSDVTIPWNYTLNENENIASVEWHFTPFYRSKRKPECHPGWLPWVNRDNRHKDRVGDDTESLARAEMVAGCPGGRLSGVQCRVSGRWYPIVDREAGGVDGLTCNLRDGLWCSGKAVFPALCNDYEVRYCCQCTASDDVSGADDEMFLADVTMTSRVVRQSTDTTQRLGPHSLTGTDLTLLDVNEMDQGVYKVLVLVHEYSYFREHTHSVFLNVTGDSSMTPSCATSTSSITSPTDSHDVTPTTSQHHVTTSRVLVG